MKWAVVAAAIAGCSPASPASPTIVPGGAIGELELGMTWSELRAELGEPSSDPAVLVGLVHVTWPSRRLEALLTSPDDAALADDAIVIGLATTRPPTHGVLEATYGAPSESYGGRDYYASGMAIEYTSGDVVSRVAVFPAEDAPRDGIAAPRPVDGIEVDGRVMPVIDMHLHPGNYATMTASGKAFIAGNLPSFLQAYAPDLLDRLSDTWAKHVGIAEQTALANVGHAVLFAVYAPRSTGVFSNESLLELLDDPRNHAPDGRPWAWGLASIDLENWNEDVAGDRLAALRAVLTAHADKVIGIKLAFAHQGVAFDDPTTRGIYAIAQEAGVPILHHTGFSPFPGTVDDPHAYDPAYLEPMLAEFPDVQVVLSHVGQGDARSVAHALDLAAKNDHVWLELSALGRPLLVGMDGAPVTTDEPQYPAVLAAIRERGLIPRTLFASDGPQYPGAIRSYLGKIVAGMQTAGYTADEIEDVLANNFGRLFTRTAGSSGVRRQQSHE